MSLALRDYFLIFCFLLFSIPIQMYLRQSGDGQSLSRIEKLNLIIDKTFTWLTQTESWSEEGEKKEEDILESMTSVEFKDRNGEVQFVNISREWFAMSNNPRNTHPPHVSLTILPEEKYYQNIKEESRLYDKPKRSKLKFFYKAA